jgi:hypothetical protein
MQIGRRIYYEVATGNVIVETSERQGAVVATTIEQDIEIYTALSERNRDTFGVSELSFGEHAEQLATASGYRVNPETKELEFIYEEDLSKLEGFKEMKINNLNRQCEKAIEEGFTSTVNGHIYRTNRDDQINFMGQKDELTSDAIIETVMWKTEDAGYLSHTREEWLEIYFEALANKKVQLFKYNTLKGQVLAAASKKAVDLISWNPIMVEEVPAEATPEPETPVEPEPVA